MMLRARDLRKEYAGSPRPTWAVAGVSLDVARGEFLAVCGRSGSGKSTLLALLGGLTRPSGGTVLIEETDLYALPADTRAEFRRRHIGVVFQFAGLLPTLRAIDNVALPALLAGATEGGDDRYARAAELLALVGLADRMEAYPAELSGGQQRRVALARALINGPPLLLADEPTADLDAETAAEILPLLLELHRRHAHALVVVTHDETLAGAADRVVRLEGGRIAAVQAPHRVAMPAPILPLRPAAARGLAAASPVAPSVPSAQLGSGLGRLLTRSFGGLALAIGAIAAADYGAARYERHLAAQRQAVRRLLEETALQQLRADVEGLSAGSDGTYNLTLYLQNLDSDVPLFVTSPAVRVFVQVDRDWVEVPSRTADASGEAAFHLSGRQTFRLNFKPEVPRFMELIPGYMHVRFTNTMLISRDRHAVGGLYERSDDYYIYLKPHGADDAAIRRQNHWTTAPLWIPMPPH
jgi:putative ABC transport system ATP-binding protein/macrolide transport system ATP-binding/permease protein/lipoprotein-releasing system ATP-binding protein